MQVNSGNNKGTLLFVPEGENIRPTSDKVKQAIFNIISFSVSDGNVLDLFAGSGSLGIEALSRGFKFCDFSDLDTACVKKNTEKCRLNDKCEIHTCDFKTFISGAKRKYSLVFLDPPYHKELIPKALTLLCEKNLPETGAVIVMESDYNETYDIPDEIKVTKEKRYGRIKIQIGVYEK